MRDDFPAGFVCGFLVTAIALALSFGISIGVHKASWQADAIERGFAEYHQTTGAWQWKDTPAAHAAERKE